MTTLQNRSDVEPCDHAVPNTFDEIMSAAHDMVPELRRRAEEIEESNRLPADIVEKLRAAGIFRMGFPERFGGPGLNSVQQIRIVETISYGDASTGWCAMVGMDAGMYQLSDAAVDEMFANLDVVVAGMLLPAGRAERVSGGYRLTGEWRMASGLHHADWTASGAFVFDSDGSPMLGEDGSPTWRIFLVPPDEVSPIENWHSTGLSGSGSVDYKIDDAFVPEAHTFSLTDPTRAGALGASDALMRKMPGVALGVARAALDYFREIAAEKVNSATGRRWADDYRIQYSLGQCEMQYISMRHGVYSTLEERWNRLEAGADLVDLSPDERIATALARTNAMRTARDIVRRLYDLLASTSIYKPSPMDRWLRDLETMCQHVMAQDKVIQSCGAHLLGGTPEFPLVLGLERSSSQRQKAAGHD